MDADIKSPAEKIEAMALDAFPKWKETEVGYAVCKAIWALPKENLRDVLTKMKTDGEMSKDNKLPLVTISEDPQGNLKLVDLYDGHVYNEHHIDCNFNLPAKK